MYKSGHRPIYYRNDYKKQNLFKHRPIEMLVKLNIFVYIIIVPKRRSIILINL